MEIIFSILHRGQKKTASKSCDFTSARNPLHRLHTIRVDPSRSSRRRCLRRELSPGPGTEESTCGPELFIASGGIFGSGRDPSALSCSFEIRLLSIFLFWLFTSKDKLSSSHTSRIISLYITGLSQPNFELFTVGSDGIFFFPTFRRTYTCENSDLLLHAIFHAQTYHTSQRSGWTPTQLSVLAKWVDLFKLIM